LPIKDRLAYNDYMREQNRKARERKKAEAEIAKPLIDAAVNEHSSFTINPLQTAQERLHELEDLQKSVLAYIDEHKRLKVENTSLKAHLDVGIQLDPVAVQKRLTEILKAPISTLEKIRRLVSPGEPEFDVSTLQQAINPLLDQLEVEIYSHNLLAPTPESKVIQQINMALKEGVNEEVKNRMLRSLAQPLTIENKQGKRALLRAKGQRRPLV